MGAVTSPPIGRFPLSNPAAVSVFRALLAHGPVSRGDIARHTGLSAGAVTKAVRPLLAAGLLEEGEAEFFGSGRPVRNLQVRPDAATFAGIKLTDTEIIAALATFSGASISATRAQLETSDVDQVVQALAAVLEELTAGTDVAALCVTLSGDVDREHGLVRFSPFLHWEGIPLAQLVEQHTGIPTVIENDVRALTLTEAGAIDGLGVTPLVVVTIGAGIGCGIVIDGEPLIGAHGVSGELGHLPVGPDDVECYCGGRGCLEAIASERAIERALGGITAAEAAEAARHGNRQAQQVFQQAGTALGKGLAALANLVGPRRILVLGEAVTRFDLLDAHVRQAFNQQAYGAAQNAEILVRGHSFDHWALGACAVARDALLDGDLRIPSR